MNSAQKMKLKRLIVAVASSEARIVGFPNTKRIPATTWPRSASSVGGSSGEIELRKNAEKRNETESTSSAKGAFSAWTRRPPRLGPATNENARLPARSELAETYSSRSTTETKSDA